MIHNIVQTHFSCACDFSLHFIMFTHAIRVKAQNRLAGDLYLCIYFNINLCVATFGNYEIYIYVVSNRCFVR